MSQTSELRATLRVRRPQRDVPVTITKLSSSRAFVEGLEGTVIRAGSEVELVLEDEGGALVVPGQLDWIAARSGVRLLCLPPAELRRLHRLMRGRTDASGVVAVVDPHAERDERATG
ncbi:MAG TPA: hypothetical protein RMH99_31645 [Sandaracinaceae bacterium LLY-WYZ-13_1]|nr:hypothetical protein [Sandaracinaceae bacterium LLY-WYZ-13_1]